MLIQDLQRPSLFNTMSLPYMKMQTSTSQKNVSTMNLIQKEANHLSLGEVELESSSHGTSNNDAMAYKCLIANDDEMQLSILDMLFQSAKFEVHLARNGFEAH